MPDALPDPLARRGKTADYLRMDLTVSAPEGVFEAIMVAGPHRIPCALGSAGLRPHKREGDGATPVGAFPLRRLWLRRDRLAPGEEGRLSTGLPIRPITRQQGWCDDPASAAYNRPVPLPHAERCESLWREDPLYDLLIEVGYNDAPVVAGMGSAIFIHLAAAAPNLAPTRGCVALNRADLLSLLPKLTPGSRLITRLAAETREAG